MTFDTLVLAPFSQHGLSSLEHFGQVTYEPWTETQTLQDPEELGRRIAETGFAGLIVEADFLFDELFSSASPLRFAAVCRGALNHVDLDAATEHGVAVVHTPGRNAQAVAELVQGLVLSLARQIPRSIAYVQAGAWQDPTDAYIRFQGREVQGATLGIIGLGQIGRRVARLARGLGMRVVAHDPYVQAAKASVGGVSLVGLEELLAQSAFISVHIPDTPETAGLLNAERLGMMQHGAYLINVTAPTVLDQQALVAAVRDGRLAGAALDVHASHPLPPDAPLLALAREGYNVLLTPHIGGATLETVERHSHMVVEDLERFLSGQRPKRLANPEVWKRAGHARDAQPRR